MKVNDMNKYQLTERMKELIMIITDPNTSMSSIPEEILEEILNPPTDDDGYVHKFYLKDGTKDLIELLTSCEIDDKSVLQ